MVKDSDTRVLKEEGGEKRGEKRVRVSPKEAGPGIKAEMRFSPPKKWWEGEFGGGKFFQAREREVPRNPDGWQKESSLKRRKGRGAILFHVPRSFPTFEVGPWGELKLKREAN